MDELLIGTRGWRFPHWVGEFYPADMPEDWWFSYYSNEFRSVLVPADDWSAVSTERLESWISDTREDFKFFLEVPAGLPWSRLKPKIKLLADQLGGVVVTPDTVYGGDIEVVEPLLFQLGEYCPVCVESSVVSQFTKTEAQSVHMLCSAHYCQGDWSLSSQLSNFLIAVVYSNNNLDAKSMRALVEDCVANQHSGLAGVFFAGTEPSVQNVTIANMIYDLLG